MTVLKVRICLASCTSHPLQFTKLTLKHRLADSSFKVNKSANKEIQFH